MFTSSFMKPVILLHLLMDAEGHILDLYNHNLLVLVEYESTSYWNMSWFSGSRFSSAFKRQLSPLTLNVIIRLPGRLGEPEEVAGLVEFLALNPAASYITGQVHDTMTTFALNFSECYFIAFQLTLVTRRCLPLTEGW